MFLVADKSLTTPHFLSFAAPVTLAEPSSTALDELRRQLLESSRLAEKELDKGAGPDKDLVAQLQKERDFLGADIDRQSSGELQLCEGCAVRSCTTCLRLAAFISMHTDVVVTRASCLEPQVRSALFVVRLSGLVCL